MSWLVAIAGSIFARVEEPDWSDLLYWKVGGAVTRRSRDKEAAAASAAPTSPSATPLASPSIEEVDDEEQEEDPTPALNIQRRRRWMEFHAGYFIDDFAYILPLAHQYPADIIHHICGLALSVTVLRRLRTMHDLIAPVLRLEVSTVVLNAMWFVREFQLGGRLAGLNSGLQRLFFVLFAFTRVYWFPRFVHALRRHRNELWVALGPTMQSMLVGLVGLNLYWFLLIGRKLF